MRALIVLVLALALAAGGYFLFTKTNGSTQKGTDNSALVEDPLPGGPATPDPEKEEPVNLQGGDFGTERVTQPLAEQGSETGAASITTNPGSDTGKVLGRVVNLAGEPIGGANVTLTRFGGASLFFSGPGEIDRSTDRVTTTQKDGRFEFAAVEAFNMYTLLADHDSYAPIEFGPVDTTGGAVVEQELVLGDGARLFGQIKDTQGNSVPGAVVTLTLSTLGAAPGDGGPGKREAKSDASGRYEFLHCAKGPHVLTVSAQGYGQATVQNLVISGDDAVERNVELEVAQLMGGRVTDQGGLPIEGAKIDAFSITNAKDRTQTHTVTNKDGKFEFQDVASGSYTLRATAAGFKVATVNRVNAGELNIEMQLVPLPTVSGQVFDSTGAPVTQYTINLRSSVQNSDLSMLVGGSRTQVKDPEGRYKLTLPMAGQFTVEATATGYAPTLSNPFTAADAQNLSAINVKLTTGGTIRGRLVAQDGSPIANATVKTENNEWTGGGFDMSLGESFPGMSTKKSVKTGANGEFVLRGLHPTQYLVQFDHADYAQTALRNVAVSEGVETNMQDIRLEKGSVLTGVVRGPGGAVLSGATVNMILETTSEFPLQYSARTNKDGIYEIKNVRSGTYFLSANRPSTGGDNPFAGAADMAKTRRKISISGDGKYQGEDFEITD